MICDVLYLSSLIKQGLILNTFSLSLLLQNPLSFSSLSRLIAGVIWDGACLKPQLFFFFLKLPFIKGSLSLS
jgi:hypothetical protein